MQALIRRLRSFVSRHRAATVIALLLVVALGIAGVAYFEPHKLFVDDRIDEAVPAGTPVTGPTAGQTTPPASPPSGVRAIARSSFRSLEHTTRGEALLLERPDGGRLLRLEGFATSNGPDLRVYLSAGDDDAFFGRAYGRDFVELGALKGNVGNQNYAVPTGLDLSRYRNAVIWCKRFAVGFGVATLS